MLMMLSYQSVVYGWLGRILVFSSSRVAWLVINIGRTDLETRGGNSFHALQSSTIFGRRRFEYPIFRRLLSRWNSLSVTPMYSRPARNVQIRDMFWFTVIIPLIPTFLLSHSSLLCSNDYRQYHLVFSYPIDASPDVVHLVVDFVEQDGSGLVTGITSLFGIVH